MPSLAERDHGRRPLGDLGLRPPIAPMVGPNVEARQRGIKLLQEALAEAAKD